MEKTGNEIGSPKAVSRNDRATRRRSMGVVGLMVAVVAFLATSGNPAGAATAPTLGTAKSFAVLAATTVTNTGPSVITGDVGVFPGLAVTGFPPGEVRNGTIYRGGDVAANARADALTAYNSLAGEACAPENNLTGRDLGGLTLTAGVYCFSSAAELTGTLTLNAEGDPNALFIFQVGSTLITAPDSNVVLINGASPCNVFWQVGSSATLGTNTNFVGTVIALQSITANTGADVEGRLLALNGAVTLDTNDVDASRCTTGTTTTTTTVPVDGTTSTTEVDTTTSTTEVDTTTSTTEVDTTTSTTEVDTTTSTTGVDTTTSTTEVDTTTSTTGVDTTTSTTEVDTTTSTTEVDTTTSTTEVDTAREAERDGLTGNLRTGGHGMLPRTGTAAHTMTLTGVLAIVVGSLALLVADLRQPAAAPPWTRRGRSRHHQRRRRPWSWPWPSWAAGTKRSTWPRR